MSARTYGPPADHVLTTELDGHVTLYDPDRNEVHSLNETAGAIWRLLDGGHDLDAVVDALAREYAVDADAIRPHVEQTVATFVAHGLVPER